MYPSFLLMDLQKVTTDGSYQLPQSRDSDALVEFLLRSRTTSDGEEIWSCKAILEFVRNNPTQISALLNHIPISLFIELYNRHGFLKTYMNQEIWERMVKKSRIRAGIVRDMSEYIKLNNHTIGRLQFSFRGIQGLQDCYLASSAIVQLAAGENPTTIRIYSKSKHISPAGDICVSREADAVLFKTQGGVNVYCDRMYYKRAFDILYGGVDDIIMDVDTRDIYCTILGYQRLCKHIMKEMTRGTADMIRTHMKSFGMSRYRPRYINQRCCYSCKRRYDDSTTYGRYTHMCIYCGYFNHKQLQHAVPLSNVRALVTGVRHKIGFQIVLRLLRSGATVIGTTRFVGAAFQNYRTQPDWPQFKDRLTILCCDYTNLAQVEAVILAAQTANINCFINNACQTVRSSPSYLKQLADVDRLLLEHPLALNASTQGESTAITVVTPVLNKFHDITDRDVGTVSSWKKTLTQIDPQEILETSVINQIIPTLMVQRLLPTVRSAATPAVPGFVIQVTAVEGQFDASKQETHPHTNMCKAAMNMLIRTLSEGADRNVNFYTIDPGYVSGVLDPNNEDYPLEAEDGAARVLQPLTAFYSGEPLPRDWVHIKDYKPAPW